MQVQDRVLDAADVLVDRHPVVGDLAVPRRLVVVRVEVAQEVPGGVDEGVHRVGLAARRARRSAGRSVLTQSSAAASGDLALGRVVLDVGQHDRQLVLGHRDDAAALAVDDRDRAAPVALAREQPVAQPVVDGELAAALAPRASR